MSLWALDTDMATLMRAGHPAVCRQIAARSPADLALPIVTVEEMLSGWYTQIRKARHDAEVLRAYAALQQSVEFAARVRILPFDQPALQQFHRLRALRLRIGTNDLRISAIVLVQRAVLVTRNLADFSRVPGLTLEDWS